MLRKGLLLNIRRKMFRYINEDFLTGDQLYPTWTKKWWEQWGNLVDTEHRIMRGF